MVELHPKVSPWDKQPLFCARPKSVKNAAALVDEVVVVAAESLADEEVAVKAAVALEEEEAVAAVDLVVVVAEVLEDAVLRQGLVLDEVVVLGIHPDLRRRDMVLRVNMDPLDEVEFRED